MFGYVIKKAFFDLWDNIILFIVSNLLFTLVLIASLIGISLAFPVLRGISYMLVLLPLCVLSIIATIVQGYAWHVAAGNTLDRDIRKAILKKAMVPALFHALLVQVFLAGGLLGLPYYWALQPEIGFIYTIVYIWLCVVFVLASLFFYPVIFQLEAAPKVALKKSFLVFMHNPAAACSMVFGIILMTALSCITLGIFPGIAGLSLWNQTTLRFLLAKHAYLEKNPAQPGDKLLPWNNIVSEDIQRIGKRSVRGLFFPWHDVR